MSILGNSIEILIKSICDQLTITDTDRIQVYIKQVRELSQSEFQKQFVYYYTDMRRQKLGVYYSIVVLYTIYIIHYSMMCMYILHIL